MDSLLQLAERVERAEGPDRELDAEIAENLGWYLRRVTGLGMNGRTPGRWLWFAPGGVGPKAIPRFTGPRKRASTIAALRARALTQETAHANVS